jgi:competence protein ComEA
VVAVLACVVAGWLAWGARPRTDTVAAVPVASGGPPIGGPSPVPAEVVVAVEGDVRRPGLIHLPSGARVADAVEGAGGLTRGARTVGLNLARKVVDGELITVGGGTPAAASAPGGDTGGRVDLNTATVAQLDALPGVGPVLAQRIVDHRQQHGPFRSVEALRDVNGIGEARFADLRGRVTV